MSNNIKTPEVGASRRSHRPAREFRARRVGRVVRSHSRCPHTRDPVPTPEQFMHIGENNLLDANPD